MPAADVSWASISCCATVEILAVVNLIDFGLQILPGEDSQLIRSPFAVTRLQKGFIILSDGQGVQACTGKVWNEDVLAERSIAIHKTFTLPNKEAHGCWYMRAVK